MIAGSTIAPTLRFPGFQETITACKVSDIAKVTSGGTPSRQKAQYWNGSIPWVTTSLVGFNRITSAGEFISADGLKNSATKVFPRGTVIMALYGQGVTRGKVAILDIDAATNQACAAMLIKDGQIVSDFLFYELQRRYDELRNLSNDGSQKNLSGDLLKNLSITVPSLPEQRKIAEFLTAVDRRIQQLSQKKDLLEDYKKGVMHQIFTQALRFEADHGSMFPDWEEKQYANVYTFQNTNSFSRELLTYDRGEVRNIHYGDIHTKFRSNFYLTKEMVPFIKPNVDISRISEDYYLQAGDLVIADASEDYADVGKCIEIMDLGGQRTLAGLHTFIARPKKGVMAPGFGGYLMQCREMRLKIMTVAQGTKVLGVSKTQLSQLMLPIPSVREQSKIANFLAALDRKIESVAQQITHTQAFKQGLLQQMFV